MRDGSTTGSSDRACVHNRLSYMEILFLRKQFGGGGAYLDYQKFTNS